MITSRQKAQGRDRERKKQAERRILKHDALGALRSALRACADREIPHSAIIYIVEGHVGYALEARVP